MDRLVFDLTPFGVYDATKTPATNNFPKNLNPLAYNFWVDALNSEEFTKDISWWQYTRDKWYWVICVFLDTCNVNKISPFKGETPSNVPSWQTSVRQYLENLNLCK